jgi:hypothetical protein
MATTKNTDRPLMRQKINVSPVLIKKWEAEYRFDIRQMVHGSLLTNEDLNTTFEHQGRTFEIVGMGEGRAIMLRETREEGVFYWETTRHFVQMKLERYNKAFQKLPNGKTILVDMPYDSAQLHLAPKNTKRRKAAPVEEVETEYDPTEIIIDELDEEIIDETTNEEFEF